MSLLLYSRVALGTCSDTQHISRYFTEHYELKTLLREMLRVMRLGTENFRKKI